MICGLTNPHGENRSHLLQIEGNGKTKCICISPEILLWAPGSHTTLLGRSPTHRGYDKNARAPGAVQ